MKNIIPRLTNFYQETVKEVKACTWPTRPDLVESTLLVIITTIGITVYIGMVDIVSQKAIQFIITM